MNILVACEESQAVCIAFRKKGHRAFSCDIQDCSGGHPEWHIKDDVIPLLNGDCDFDTCDRKHHKQEGEWDMLIAFPPCTDLAVSGARHFEKKRADGRQKKALSFSAKCFQQNAKGLRWKILYDDEAKEWVLDVFEEGENARHGS